MKSTTLKTAVIALFASFFIMGCEPGPAEKAGESIDEAATDVGNKIEDTCEEVKEGVNAEETNC
ncbi:MAG: hypothetical protein ACTH4U_11345 [Pseudoalteromonas prydzensis]|uniref:YtxH domain-containing protein n=1 Tax=Pseudoalteromonas prydzensis TaxID=182141 RepID=A0A7V1CZH0_9GAMM|nr:hypothetical protein [Pseudoalteromonas prydzensis]HEA17065.1 hypothetical protein [Pseudoalteromonas prydzensis]